MIGMNREAGTRESVEALLRSSEPFFLSLTNQNSNDGTGAYFDEVSSKMEGRTFVFHESKNTFFQPPNNRAYLMAVERGCEFFLCLNDDAIIPPDGLRKMMEIMDVDQSIAVVGAKGGCESLSDDFHGQPGPLEFVEGSCAMYRISALRKHRKTLFWEALSGIYAEDAEASLFLREKGWRIAKANFDLPHARSQTVNRDAETRAACHAFQENNHRLCKARFKNYLKSRRFDLPIVIKRQMALGDVILMTPIVRAIKETYPLSAVHVQTDFPKVFDGNPCVERADKKIENLPDQITINLDGAYEDRPMRHVLDCYKEVANGSLFDIGTVQWKTELFAPKRDMQWAQATCAAVDGSVCIVHADESHWSGKHVPSHLLEYVAARLRKSGWKIILAGSCPRIDTKIGCDLDLTNKTTIHQLSALCAHAKLFIGPDSGPMHVAQSSGCPTVGIFGVTSPRFLATRGSKFSAVESSRDIPSSGMRHRISGVTFTNEGADAMASITDQDVWRAIERLEVL